MLFVLALVFVLRCVCAFVFVLAFLFVLAFFWAYVCVCFAFVSLRCSMTVLLSVSVFVSAPRAAHASKRWQTLATARADRKRRLWP